MGNPAEEKRVFEGFLDASPLFAGAAVTKASRPKKDPPDIECDLVDGRRIGIELTSWLKEFGPAKTQETLEESIYEALKPWPANQTEHIHQLWMFPKRRMLQKDAAAFRAELLKMTDEIDCRCSSETDWQTPQDCQWNDFSTYPKVGKYLETVDIHPRIPSQLTTMRKGGLLWLIPQIAGSYSPNQMVDVLCECVQAKIAKYPAKPIGMDKFHLLLHYDKAWQYNTPVKGIDFGYAEAVQTATTRIGCSAGVFDRIFVFVPIAKGQQVFSLYPS